MDEDRAYILEWITEEPFYRITGVSRGEFDNSISLYHPDDVPKMQADMQKLLSGQINQNEYRIFTKSGELRWIEMTRKPIWNEMQNRVVRFYGVGKDITSRKRAENRLRESEERYRTLVEAFPDIIIISDLSGKILFANSALQAQTGLSIEEYNQPGRRGGIHPDDQHIVRAAIIKLMNSEDTASDMIENRFIDKYGRVRWYSGVIVKTYWDNAIALQTVTRDITDRKIAENAILQLNTELEEKATQLTTLNEIARDVSSLTDLHTTLKRVLEKLKTTLPVDAFYVALFDAETEIVSFPIMYDVGQFWDQPSALLSRTGWIAQVIDTGNPYLLNRTPEEMNARISEKTRLGDTSKVSASILIAPLSLGGQNIGVISIQSYTPNSYNARHIDLLVGSANQIAIAVENARLYDSLRNELNTCQQAEREILQLNAELEQRVEQRTAQLAVVNRELEAFAYSISHDLRAPLRSIDGFSRMVMETNAENLDAFGQTYLNRIPAATQRMGEMIDALLTLSRVTRSDLNIQRVDLSGMAQSIMEGLMEAEPQRQVQVSIAPGLFTRGDSRLLQVLLENLLGNAWKYTSKKPEALIEFGCNATDNRKIFYVRDNGAGFDPAYTDKLFGVFQRLHTEQEFPGTGVGLATVQRIVHRHSGTIWAESAIDKGASFYFYLRAAAD